MFKSHTEVSLGGKSTSHSTVFPLLGCSYSVFPPALAFSLKVSVSSLAIQALKPHGHGQPLATPGTQELQGLAVLVRNNEGKEVMPPLPAPRTLLAASCSLHFTEHLPHCPAICCGEWPNGCQAQLLQEEAFPQHSTTQGPFLQDRSMRRTPEHLQTLAVVPFPLLRNPGEDRKRYGGSW